MKKKMLFILLMLCSAQLFASTVLEQTIGARPLGLGECFTGLADDINSIFSNPAGTYNIKGKEVSLLYYDTLSDTTLTTLATGVKMQGRGGAISVGYSTFDGGKFEEIDGSGNLVRTVKALTETLAIVNYSNCLKQIDDEKQILVGLSAKSLSSKLVETYPASTMALDAGILYQSNAERSFSFGVAVQNAGAGLKYDQVADPLPMKVKAGFAIGLMDTYKYTFRVLGEAVSSSRTKQTTIGAGVEYGFAKLLYLRAGYRAGDVRKMTFGFGVNVRNAYVLNYGTEMLGDVENLSQFSFGFGF
ncbi:MAG: hypothetical protein A2252_00710 [Elusimicrobia bacterium RIFOXYA2_FULL_39_19]|nr:MAG: hypothetical protein A2252_00710 [Elusimicrobia bacterium RIFOXYA2_FULL_39_19]